jgi:divalent metal cation (Fe/Co/Zn/Cd) transporter
MIEILASVIVVWHLRDTARSRERPALLILGVAFVLLGAYILCQAAYVVSVGDRPHTSALGIVWTAVTLAVTVVLATGKSRTGRALENRVLLTEGRVTLIDAGLAGAVLVGLVLNAATGWWWADPLASLVIVGYAFKEGYGAVKDARA